MSRGYNFGAGPAMLPASILTEVQAELLDWQGSGMSILETGHRTPAFVALMEEATQLLKTLLAIPSHYQVLWLGGAARQHFSMIPINFLSSSDKAGYLVSGLWSKMSFEEARRFKSVYCIATGESTNFTKVPDINESGLLNDTKYVYCTPNETVNGNRIRMPLSVGKIPLVADMTSSLLTERIDVNAYGLIFAGAQKTLANAGLTVVIVREDWLHDLPEGIIPSMMDYRLHAKEHSLFSTPPTFNCYLALKMLRWIAHQGGVSYFSQQNQEKAEKLYGYIDESEFYSAPVAKPDRSYVNICFNLKNTALNECFISKATQENLYALQGHRLVGGMRASLYNAMPMEGVEALISFMNAFALEYAS